MAPADLPEWDYGKQDKFYSVYNVFPAALIYAKMNSGAKTGWAGQSIAEAGEHYQIWPCAKVGVRVEWLFARKFVSKLVASGTASMRYGGLRRRAARSAGNSASLDKEGTCRSRV